MVIQSLRKVKMDDLGHIAGVERIDLFPVKKKRRSSSVLFIFSLSVN